jgi:excisionase family DNA binding protein
MMTHVPNTESCDANSAKAPAPKITNLDREAGLLSVMEAAAYLNISRAHLYELLKQAEFARIKIGRRTLFERRDLDAFVARHRTTATEI